MTACLKENVIVELQPMLKGKDSEVALAFERLRRALSREERESLTPLVNWLEDLCSQRFADLGNRARSIADANAEAVELLVEHDETATRLRRQNLDLASQTRSLADANADAVCLLFERAEALDAARQSKQELEQQNLELEHRVSRDKMTGLYNFGYFAQQREREFARARRYNHDLSLVFLDIDHFKHYNDRNGHLAGNVALKKMAELISLTTRDADTKARRDTGSFAVRFGGEEFVLVLPLTPHEGAIAVAERLRTVVEGETFPYGEHQPLGRVTISVGVSSLMKSDVDASSLTKRADEALYRAKRNGRNRVCS